MSGLLHQATIVCLVLTAPAYAQFGEMAATDDGKQLFFTSRMLMKGGQVSSRRPESRLYQHGAVGVRLVAERGVLAPQSSFTSADGVSRPSTSGDGGVVGFTLNNVCRTPANCVEVVSSRAEVRGRETVDLGEGIVQISRDGLWALLINEIYDYSQPQVIGISTTTSLVELSTGLRTTPPGPPYVDGHPSWFTLASDGAVLSMVPDRTAPPGIGGVTPPAYGIWRRGQFTRIPLPAGEGLAPFALSGDGGTVVSYGYAPSGRRIAVTSLRLGKSTTVFESGNPEQVPVFMAASNNGQIVLFRVTAPGSLNGPSFVWDATTGAVTPIALEAGELANDGTLSGDGKVAFVATTHFRIVGFDIRLKTGSPLFPQTPFCDDPGPVGGGSLARLRCTLPGGTESLEGKVEYDGRAMPVVYSIPGEIGVQIPWEWDNFFPPTFSLKVGSDSPFEASQPLRVYDGAPRILPNDSGKPSLFGIKIIKDDWSGFVTGTPALGDVFYIYMTGLGWTERREKTGVPASSAAPNPIQWRLDCRFLPDGNPLELLFAGLAPDTTGVYQTAFRMPRESGGVPATGIRCTLESSIAYVEFGPDLPVPGLTGRGSVAW